MIPVSIAMHCPLTSCHCILLPSWSICWHQISSQTEPCHNSVSSWNAYRHVWHSIPMQSDWNLLFARLNHLSFIMRKPVFWVFYQVWLKLSCPATEASLRLDISDIETGDIILSMQRTTKALIRLRRCAGWSASLLFAYGKNRFSHDVAQL